MVSQVTSHPVYQDDPKQVEVKNLLLILLIFLFLHFYVHSGAICYALLQTLA